MTSPASPELAACPFCGNRDVAQGASGDYISVWCNCGARGPDVPFPQDCDPVPPILDCYAAWNRRASPVAAGAVVKALEWRKPDDHPKDPDSDDCLFAADGIGGVYAVSVKQSVGPAYLLWWAHDPMDWSGFDTIEAAKAAAQADYERRILSALNAGPVEATTEAMSVGLNLLLLAGVIRESRFDAIIPGVVADQLEAADALLQRLSATPAPSVQPVQPVAVTKELVKAIAYEIWLFGSSDVSRAEGRKELDADEEVQSLIDGLTEIYATPQPAVDASADVTEAAKEALRVLRQTPDRLRSNARKNAIGKLRAALEARPVASADVTEARIIAGADALKGLWDKSPTGTLSRMEISKAVLAAALEARP